MSLNAEDIQPRVIEENDAKCPSCSAAIKFDPLSGLLKCPYCHYEEVIPLPEAEQDLVAQELDFHEAVERGNFNWGEEKKAVICNSCAAESIYDALEVANVCPYCGSNHLMESSAENSLAPNGIIPFNVSHEQANENSKRWIKGKWFAPNEAKRTAKADNFAGIYLPYWTFDSKTASRYTARYGKHRSVTNSQGKTTTRTDWYSTSGFYQEFIDDELVRATKRYDSGLLGRIEPFDTRKPIAYTQDYLTGYVAERYSVGLEDGWKIAQNNIHSHLEGQISSVVRRRHRADVVSSVRFSTVHSDVTYKYIMLPIWLSSYRYKEKAYQFLVNGQTGKVGGESPISAIKVTFATLTALIIIAVVYFYYQQ